MASVAEAPILEARQVTKTYDGTTALAGVDFRLERGRVHALIGENGAGKSTLLKILAGIEQPTAGTLWLEGQATRFGSARDASARGISIIHQELQLFPDLTVAENLFVGRERRTRWGTVASTNRSRPRAGCWRRSVRRCRRARGSARCRSASSRSSRSPGRSCTTRACC